jgi:hypothetical protein
MTNIDTPRKGRGGPRANSGGARPGAGRKPIGATAGEATLRVRLDAATRAYWQGSGRRGELSTNIRRLLTDVADGDAVVMSIDTAVHMAVAPWLAARLAEVEALDLDDTGLEDWLRALMDALADASQRRRAPDAGQGE